MGEGQPCQIGICHFGQGCGNPVDSVSRYIAGFCLTEDECEIKDEFIIVRQAE